MQRELKIPLTIRDTFWLLWILTRRLLASVARFTLFNTSYFVILSSLMVLLRVSLTKSFSNRRQSRPPIENDGKRYDLPNMHKWLCLGLMLLFCDACEVLAVDVVVVGIFVRKLLSTSSLLWLVRSVLKYDLIFRDGYMKETTRSCIGSNRWTTCSNFDLRR